MKRLFILPFVIYLLGCNAAPTQLPLSAVPNDHSELQAASPSPTVAAKALYLVRNSGQIDVTDLKQHPEVVAIHTFADLQQRLTSTETSIWIDKNALGSIPTEWLMQAPQKFCPLVIVGYNNALYSFRDSLPGFGIGSPISGPYVDWSAQRIEPGFSVWLLQPRTDAPTTNYSAVMQGYDRQPTITAIFGITDRYIVGNPYTVISPNSTPSQRIK